MTFDSLHHVARLYGDDQAKISAGSLSRGIADARLRQSVNRGTDLTLGGSLYFAVFMTTTRRRREMLAAFEIADEKFPGRILAAELKG